MHMRGRSILYVMQQGVSPTLNQPGTSLQLPAAIPSLIRSQDQAHVHQVRPQTGPAGERRRRPGLGRHVMGVPGMMLGLSGVAKAAKIPKSFKDNGRQKGGDKVWGGKKWPQTGCLLGTNSRSADLQQNPRAAKDGTMGATSQCPCSGLARDGVFPGWVSPPIEAAGRGCPAAPASAPSALPVPDPLQLGRNPSGPFASSWGYKRSMYQAFSRNLGCLRLLPAAPSIKGRPRSPIGGPAAASARSGAISRRQTTCSSASSRSVEPDGYR